MHKKELEKALTICVVELGCCGGCGDGTATLGADATTGAAIGGAGICPGIGPGAATLVETVATPGCCENRSRTLNTPQQHNGTHAKQAITNALSVHSKQ